MVSHPELGSDPSIGSGWDSGRDIRYANFSLNMQNNKNKGCRSHRYRYRFGSGGLYRYRFATASTVPVPLQRGTGTSLRICPEMADFTIFHVLFFHNSLLFHPSLEFNMESLQTTPQTLLISQRIQRFIPKFTQTLQNLGIVKDSISTYYQLGIFNPTSLKSRVRMYS